VTNFLESIGRFLNRLEIYTEVLPTETIYGMVVEILVELLSTLALTTRETKQGRLSESILDEGIYYVTHE